jgi:2,3-diketo-5-methylthio-1-phosphopentane phosphatase
MAGSIVVLDFDGTLTTTDVGDDLCDRYAPPAWREVDAAYARGEMSLPEAQRRMWAMVRATREEAVRGAHAVGRLRDGLDALLDAIEAAGAEAWIASGGFDFYIEALLGERRLGRFARRYANTIRFDGDRLEPGFPHEGLACARCAVCKGKVCALAAATGARVLFAGDGHSDRCVLRGQASVAAVRGSRLHAWALEEGVACAAFDRLDELVPRVRALGGGAEPGAR